MATQVSGLSAGTGAGAAATASASLGGAAAKLGRDEFLKLLMAQLRYQNPLEPIKDSDFAAQLAQFSTLDGIQKLGTDFGDLLRLQGLTQGANLIGKRVTYDRPGESEPHRGMVDSVKVENGKIQLMVGTTAVALEQVRAVELPAAAR